MRRKDLHVRPVTIQVVDYETESPLAGIQVIYSLDKYRVSILPMPLSLIYMESSYYGDGSIIETHRFVTDAEGEIFVPARIFRFDEQTYIGHETYFINLDRTSQSDAGITLDEQVLTMLKYDASFFSEEIYNTPDAAHRGCYVRIMNFEVDTARFGLQDTSLSDYLYLDSQSFEKPKEKIRVLLRRHRGK